MKLIRTLTCVATLGIAAALGAMNCAGRTAPPPNSGSTEANITRLTTSILGESQFAHHPLDSDLAGKFLESYLDALDGSRSLFLKSDVDEFAAAYRANLAQATGGAGDTTAAHAIFKRYLERAGQRSRFVADTAKTKKFDFKGHDVYSVDREHAERPRDLAAAQELWRQQFRAEYLQEKLGDAAPADIAGKLTHKYARQVEMMKALGNDEVLEVYLNALAHVYDPHSDYLGHEQMESLSIAMNLSLFGIGASLENADGFCTIREVLPGGPAARSSALKPGDRIVAVAQAGKDAVDVVNMPLSRTVELIRGPKGSTVTLSIVPAGAADSSPPKPVALVRDQIQLQDQEAKARIVDLPRENGTTLRLGVLDVPEFYADMGEQGEGKNRSVTLDVARLLTKLKAEGVQGIVLDLRRNGGGSLKEAVSLTGLFIKQGPIVQTRGPTGGVEVNDDPDPSVAYDGPLVVLTTRFSASASEIMAGALQDYGRAVIVGDSQTFGKGTVQSILPLARIMEQNGLSHAYDPGALKVTIRKFYRPGGASTQLRGVAADVVLPSASDISDVSESALKEPLPWDVVPSTKYEHLNRVAPFVGALREKSARRVATAKEFAELQADVVRFKKTLTSKTVSLNEEERRQEMLEMKKRRAEREQEVAALHATEPKTYELGLKEASLPGLPPPRASKADAGASSSAAAATAHDASSDGASLQGLAEDITLQEGVKILADYTDLLRGPKPAAP